MTALAQGTSVSAVLRDGGTVSIATNGGFGSVVVTPVGGSASIVNIGPAPVRQVFGPYSEGAAVTVTNASCNAFDYDAETLTDPANGTPLFIEDFRRANTAAGSIGGGWTLKGAYAGSYPLPAATTGEVAGMAFTNAGGSVVYAMRTLRKTPRQLRCRFSWIDDGVGTDFTTLAMIVSSSATNLVDTMLHVTLTNSQLLVQKRIAGGAFVNLVSPVSILPSLTLADAPHLATITIEGNTARVQIDDAVDVIVQDADIPAIVGPTVAVEHYTATTSVRWPMSIYEVSAFS